MNTLMGFNSSCSYELAYGLNGQLHTKRYTPIEFATACAARGLPTGTLVDDPSLARSLQPKFAQLRGPYWRGVDSQTKAPLIRYEEMELSVSHLVVNGKTFKKNPKVRAATSESTTGICGSFCKKPGAIILLDASAAPQAAVVYHQFTSPFFVTVSRQDEGQIFYMYGTAEHTEQFLGLCGLSFTEKHSLAQAAVDQLPMASWQHLSLI